MASIDFYNDPYQISSESRLVAYTLDDTPRNIESAKYRLYVVAPRLNAFFVGTNGNTFILSSAENMPISFTLDIMTPEGEKDVVLERTIVPRQPPRELWYLVPLEHREDVRNNSDYKCSLFRTLTSVKHLPSPLVTSNIRTTKDGKYIIFTVHALGDYTIPREISVTYINDATDNEVTAVLKRKFRLKLKI